MKKTIIFFVLTLAMVLIGSCTAQSANYAQKIVGTWTSISGSTSNTTLWVFNANGSGNKTINGENLNFYWGVSDTGIIAIESTAFKIYLSPDGRRMIIEGYVYQKELLKIGVVR
jgi:hypothetical protein